MDMPVGRFDKMEAYRTATSIHEKAPALLAATLGEFFCKDKDLFSELLADFVPKLDAEILDPKQIDEDRAFVTMKTTIDFLEQCGMPPNEIDTVRWGLKYCAPLFVDLLDRGHVIEGDVLCFIAEDHRLIEHTLRASKIEHMLKDYGWGFVTRGEVRTAPVQGNHVDMVSTDGGVETFGRSLDFISN